MRLRNSSAQAKTALLWVVVILIIVASVWVMKQSNTITSSAPAPVVAPASAPEVVAPSTNAPQEPTSPIETSNAPAPSEENPPPPPDSSSDSEIIYEKPLDSTILVQ